MTTPIHGDRRGVVAAACFAALAIAAAALRLVVGPSGFGWPDAGDDVVWSLRLERVIAGAAIGASLAAAGALLQATLRNALASPFVLGLTSGAGLGIVAATYAGYLATGAVVAFRPPVWAAVAGAFAALGLVFLLGRRRGVLDPPTLILVGVIVSVMCGAATTFLQHLLPAQGMAVYTRWMMGSISEETSRGVLVAVALMTAAGVAAGAGMGRSLDASTLGDDEAASVGVRVGLVRSASFAIAGLLTAGTVVLAGPIGFVGLVCPHLVRLVGGPRHRWLVLGSACCGAALLLIADAAVSLLRLPSGRIPVGVVTALLGGPVFIVLLRRGGAFGGMGHRAAAPRGEDRG